MFNVCFVAFESIWRRAFGDDGFGLPILKHRIVLHILNVIVLFAFLVGIKGFGYYEAGYCVIVIEGLFYSSTFYAGFDLGHSYPPSPEEIKAYGIIGRILEKIFPKDKWYKKGFDFCFMTIRYTYPIVMIVYWFKLWILIIGLLVACSYAIGWRFKPFGLVTEFGEYCMGALLALAFIYG